VKWYQVEPGWWSHELYIPYVYRHERTALDFHLLKGPTDKEAPELEPIEHAIEGAYLLDKIILYWHANSFVLQDFHGDYVYLKIQVSCADLQLQFGV